MNIDWSKAPEGATHYNYRAHGSPKWYMLNNGGWFYWSDSDNGWRESGNGERFFKSLTTISNRQWTGQGLPPVGTVCEAMTKEFGDHYGWFKCTVLHVGKDECAIMLDNSLLRWCDDFRPIRTPDQIAAEERNEAIAEALCGVEEKVAKWNTTIDCTAAIKATIEIMIDAGYRKQEQPK